MEQLYCMKWFQDVIKLDLTFTNNWVVTFVDISTVYGLCVTVIKIYLLQSNSVENCRTSKSICMDNISFRIC